MSEKKSKRKQVEVVESSSEEEVVQKPVATVDSSPEASEEKPVVPKKKKKKATEEVVDEQSEEHPEPAKRKSRKNKATLALPTERESDDEVASDLKPTTPRDVHDMEAMAQASKTPRVMESVAKAASSSPEASPRHVEADAVVEQTEEDRKKIVSLPRLYFNVLECKGIKPANFFVTAAFEKETVWTTAITKKKTVWEEKGRLLPIPEGTTNFRVTLWEKGILGDVLNKKLGEASWEIANLQDGYPHQPWADLMKKTKVKCQLRVQIMYLEAGQDMVGDEFVTPLHSLIHRSKYDLLVRAVDDLFADLELLDSEGRSPLHLAVQENKPKYVKLLLKKLKSTAATLITPKIQENALHYAAKYAGQEIIKILVKAKLDLNAENNIQQTPLHYAAIADNQEAIEALLENEDCDVNSKDKEGNTPLVTALVSGSVKAIQSLVNLKADLYTKNEKDLQVWEIAQRKDLVNTEPRKVFMQAVGVNDAREFPYRKNLNAKIFVHGESCAMDYEDSTQFAISATEPTEVAIMITLEDLVASSDFVSKSGFALIRSHQGEHNEPAISRDTIAFGGNKAVSLTIEPNFFYVVVPYCKQEDAARAFDLVVLHPKKKPITVNKLKPWAHSVVIESEWVGQKAGGAQPNLTWNENPTFEVTMPKEDDVKFMVVLSQEHNDPELRYVDGDDHKKIPYDHNVGFYVLDRGAVKVLAQTDKWTDARDVHQEFVMNFSERNHISIIPASLKPGEEGPFTLKVYCDSPISMDEK